MRLDGRAAATAFLASDDAAYTTGRTAPRRRRSDRAARPGAAQDRRRAMMRFHPSDRVDSRRMLRTEAPR